MSIRNSLAYYSSLVGAVFAVGVILTGRHFGFDAPDCADLAFLAVCVFAANRIALKRGNRRRR